MPVRKDFKEIRLDTVCCYCQKNDPETGVILLMATRNPVNSPVDMANMNRYLQGLYLYMPGGDRGISEPSTASQQSRSVRLSFCVIWGLGGLDFGENFLRFLCEFFKRKYSCIRLGEIFLDLSRFR